MSGADDTEWWTTDHRLVREWAQAHDAEPVVVERADDPALELQTDPGDEPGERVPWQAFFERFEEQSRALLYRNPGASEGAGTDRPWELIDRDAVPDHLAAAEKTEPPADLDSDQLALSDTGEGEPVAFDRTEDASSTGTDEPVGTAATKDDARGATAATDSLALDTIREHSPALGELGEGDESVTVRNEGERPLDLSGWTVGNDAGRSYRIPESVTLDPGEHLTVHRGTGTDTGTDLYWDADDPVWPNRGGTVVVETPSGDHVIEATYKGG
jgi:hypothetical protein